MGQELAQMGLRIPYHRIRSSQVSWAHSRESERVKFFPRCSVIGLTVTHLEQSTTGSSADCILLQTLTLYSCGNELRLQAEEEKEGK